MFLGFGELTLVAAMAATYVTLLGVPAALICRRLGWPWYLGIVAVIPIVNIALLWFVALSAWPRAGDLHAED